MKRQNPDFSSLHLIFLNEAEAYVESARHLQHCIASLQISLLAMTETVYATMLRKRGSLYHIMILNLLTVFLVALFPAIQQVHDVCCKSVA